MTTEHMPSKGGKTLSHQQILEKAIKLAIKGGWDVPEYRNRDKRMKWPPNKISINEDYGDEGSSGWWLDIPDHHRYSIKLCDSYTFEDLIFNHQFAQALWPGDSTMIRYTFEKDTRKTIATPVPAWQDYLKQMVIAPDPIAYLGNNI